MAPDAFILVYEAAGHEQHQENLYSMLGVGLLLSSALVA